MAVMITDLCINCGDCAPECPVAAILEDTNEKIHMRVNTFM